MHSVSIRTRSAVRAISRAGALPYLTTNSVATMSAGSCPNRLASLAEPLYVDKPDIAREQRAYGTATIRIDLSAQGKLLNTRVMTSTLNSLLDRAALETLRPARFQPETRDCTPVAGSYLVDVVFPEE